MIEVKKEDLDQIAPMFSGIEDSMVIACLQGYMGKAYLASWTNPKAALIISGEYSFFGGNPNSEDAAYLVRHFFRVCQAQSSVAIFDDDQPGWETLLLACDVNHPEPVARYGIVQKDYIFDLTKLQRYADSLPPGFSLIPFDENLYAQAMAEPWSREFCETFSSAKDFLERGLGFAAVDKGKLVSAASTMTVYDGGAEIQVATRDNYRRKGLALCCAAALVKECSLRGIRPCWDAANLASKKMALKLGYEYRGEYTTIHMHRS